MSGLQVWEEETFLSVVPTTAPHIRDSESHDKSPLNPFPLFDAKPPLWDSSLHYDNSSPPRYPSLALQHPRAPRIASLWQRTSGVATATLLPQYQHRFKHSALFTTNLTIPIQSCAKPPYMPLVGNIKIWTNNQTVQCINCQLYTCINSHFDSRKSVMLVRAQEGIWILVTLPRPWESSPSIHLINEVLQQILKRSKRFVFTSIAVIMGLITVAALASTTGMTLHQSIQTAHFVNNWQANSTQMWNSLQGIDQKLANQINDLRPSVNLSWRSGSESRTSHANAVRLEYLFFLYHPVFL